MTKTDARGISTAYTYDVLNRATLRNYSDATPDISYVYENSLIPFSKGKLTKVSNNNQTTISYLTEDALGSVRAITDSSGKIKARRDFLPFGEEIYSGIGTRDINQNYFAIVATALISKNRGTRYITTIKNRIVKIDPIFTKSINL